MDMLIRLYDLPPRGRYQSCLDELALDLRRARSYEKSQVLDWVRQHFSRGWADEISAAFARDPISLFLAIREGQIVGFAAYEVTCRGFAGPIGLHPDLRGTQLCHALSNCVFHAMADDGHAYAVLGGIRPDFAPLQRRYFKAVEIPGSTPGIYTSRLLGADS
ncbi:hypothetical protein RQP53_11645 [Paucibacter sp. APW11]|uniref:N-acetyltransferase domain-containing protein n=1 Tax=Roseateles aquae TaxID=3077235 RepID=A0ABU3PBH3_9BURK|nr:hypothetical protein [Paucibacter sp. APW11]MDT8999918.1 hypothetical protein [Paucibacter sp. APW11]